MRDSLSASIASVKESVGALEVRVGNNISAATNRAFTLYRPRSRAARNDGARFRLDLTRRERSLVNMKVRYFPDTDTLLMQLRDSPIAETRDLDENTTLDLDGHGRICAITIEHATRRAGGPELTY